MSYTHLNADERLELYRLKQTGDLSLRAIATQMGRSHSTISRELKRNQNQEQMYLPDSAQVQQQVRRQQSKRPFVGISEACLARVKAQLRQYHSPEQIAGSLKFKGLEWVSHETIYQMIYQNYADLGSYRRYLRHSHIKRQHRAAKRQKRGLLPNRVGIEHRPAIAEQKSEIGHWEGDTIIGGNHLGAIATHVDKASKFLVAQVMKDRTAGEMNRVTVAAFEAIPEAQRKTMTFDNGKEFSKHEQLTVTLGVQCYFANPYHSWERGLNEHTNGLIRQFFPKGTNFRIVKQHEVDKVVELINHRPRKSLGYLRSCSILDKPSLSEI
jgi:IS30 family transposase